MNKLKSIIIYSTTFLVLTLGIVLIIIKNNQSKELNCTTPDPVPFCGTNANSSEEAIEGKQLFNSTCAACHSLDKNLTGPSLRNIDSLQLFHWLTTSKTKLDTTRIKEFKIEYHKFTWGNRLSNADIDAIFAYCN